MCVVRKWGVFCFLFALKTKVRFENLDQEIIYMWTPNWQSDSFSHRLTAVCAVWFLLLVPPSGDAYPKAARLCWGEGRAGLPQGGPTTWGDPRLSGHRPPCPSRAGVVTGPADGPVAVRRGKVTRTSSSGAAGRDPGWGCSGQRTLPRAPVVWMREVLPVRQHLMYLVSKVYLLHSPKLN